MGGGFRFKAFDRTLVPTFVGISKLSVFPPMLKYLEIRSEIPVSFPGRIFRWFEYRSNIPTPRFDYLTFLLYGFFFFGLFFFWDLTMTIITMTMIITGTSIMATGRQNIVSIMMRRIVTSVFEKGL